jgi:hypothetical protein
LGDCAAEDDAFGLPRGSLGLLRDGALELARDGGGMGSITALSLSGDIVFSSGGVSSGGGTMVASDWMLSDR